MIAAMTVYTDYLWFNTSKRREVVRITDDVASIVSKSGGETLLNVLATRSDMNN